MSYFGQWIKSTAERTIDNYQNSRIKFNMKTMEVNTEKYKTGFRRVGALFIDSMVLGILVTSIHKGLKIQNKELQMAMLAFIPYLYTIFFHYKFGQTIGKAIMKIKLLTIDETPITIKNAILRDSIPMLFMIPSLFYYQSIDPTTFQFSAADYVLMAWGPLEVITMLFNKKRRAIHDFIANTVVVRI